LDGRVLLIGPSRVGDGVLVTGLVERLIADGARLTLACSPLALPLFANVPGIEWRIAVVKRRFGLHWVGLWGATVGTHWRAVCDLRGSALGFLLRARERRVYRPVPGHRLEALAAALGLAPAEPVLRLAADDLAAGAALVPDTPFLALGPTANWPGKVWPADRFVALARALTGPGGALAGARVAVLGGPGETADAIAAALPGAHDLVGRTTPLEAAAVLARAALFVGNDSGLMHLAAAAGAPTVGLFGPSRVEHYGPRGARAVAVCTPIPYEQLFPPGYDRRTTPSLMTSLEVAPVLAACNRLLES